jgi:hypothetical protein
MANRCPNQGQLLLVRPVRIDHPDAPITVQFLLIKDPAVRRPPRRGIAIGSGDYGFGLLARHQTHARDTGYGAFFNGDDLPRIRRHARAALTVHASRDLSRHALRI